MKRAKIDCGDGWTVIVDKIDGSPIIITAQYLTEDTITAKTTKVSIEESGIVFSEWGKNE